MCSLKQPPSLADSWFSFNLERACKCRRLAVYMVAVVDSFYTPSRYSVGRLKPKRACHRIKVETFSSSLDLRPSAVFVGSSINNFFLNDIGPLFPERAPPPATFVSSSLCSLRPQKFSFLSSRTLWKTACIRPPPASLASEAAASISKGGQSRKREEAAAASRLLRPRRI